MAEQDNTKDGEKKPKVFRVMVEWEDDTFNIADIKRIKREMVVDEEAEDGVAYTLEIHVFSQEMPLVYRYELEEIRDKKYEVLKAKLEDKNIQFI